MWARRATELTAMMMIGDGLLSLAEPRRHCMLWHAGPRFWERMMEPFIDHPNMTRALGAAEFALGFWLATAQLPEEPVTSIEQVRSAGRRMREMVGMR
ncbi:MAG TPA: hypothetical protein VN541_15035 [Tepidisphaeraceae bacterium]|nr:hypothetical protein [Tepidisphaeraceae bacterium]